MADPESTTVVRRSLAGLGEQFAQDELRSSARLVIMLSLGVNGRLSFADLLEVTRCAKGSLSYHLKQLADAGLVRSSTVFTFGGPRVVVEITDKGRARYGELVEQLRALPPVGPAAADEEELVGRSVKPLNSRSG